MALTDKLTAIADAIRGKTGGTDGMTLDAMVSAIEGISGGGKTGEITCTSTIANSVEFSNFIASIGETETCMYIRPDWLDITTQTDVVWIFMFIKGRNKVSLRWRNGNASTFNLGTNVITNVPAGTIFERWEVPG